MNKTDIQSVQIISIVYPHDLDLRPVGLKIISHTIVPQGYVPNLTGFNPFDITI